MNVDPPATAAGTATSVASSAVDAALGALIADGTVQRLQRKWLTTNPSNLPTLHRFVSRRA